VAETVAQTFAELPETHNHHMATGLNCVFQFVITGDGGGEWIATFDGGHLMIAEGRHDRPNLTVTVTASDWLDIYNGKLDHRDAYAAGKWRMSGALPLMKKAGIIFCPHSELNPGQPAFLPHVDAH